jgi:steroid delta-isomerase-like uncharacterized protein
MERSAIEGLVKRWLEEGIVAGNVDVFDELLTEDVADLTGGTAVRGSEPFKRRARAVQAAFSNLEVVVDDLVIAGDRAAWRFSLTGTHTGSFAGVEPTGRRVTLRGVNFQRFADGRVSEHWTLADTFGLLAALRG